MNIQTKVVDWLTDQHYRPWSHTARAAKTNHSPICTISQNISLGSSTEQQLYYQKTCWLNFCDTMDTD